MGKPGSWSWVVIVFLLPLLGQGSALSIWRQEKQRGGEKEGREEKGKRVGQQESEEGANSPFYSESGIPDC